MAGKSLLINLQQEVIIARVFSKTHKECNHKTELGDCTVVRRTILKIWSNSETEHYTPGFNSIK